jgi:type VI secretion system secreted protein Hcp
VPGSIEGEYFLKIDGIAGESQDAKHKDEIELVSFGWGVDQTGPVAVGGGGGAGKAKLKALDFLMKVNKASPELFLAAVSGKHIKEATLSVRRAKKAALEYLKIKFEDVIVSSYEQVGDEGEEPYELVSFDFGRIAVEYTPKKSKGGGALAGTVVAGWDLKLNKKV